MSITFDELSDWVVEGNYFAYRYILGTDSQNPDNRVAAIEKTPRVQVIDSFGWTPKGKQYVTVDDSIKSFWISGYKGSDCYDEESREWCDNLLRALYPLTD